MLFNVWIYIKPLRFLLWPMLTQGLNFQRSGLEVGSSLRTRLRRGAFLKMKTCGNKLRMYHESQIKFYYKIYESSSLWTILFEGDIAIDNSWRNIWQAVFLLVNEMKWINLRSNCNLCCWWYSIWKILFICLCEFVLQSKRRESGTTFLRDNLRLVQMRFHNPLAAKRETILEFIHSNHILPLKWN